jgi:hypothetical protein
MGFWGVKPEIVGHTHLFWGIDGTFKWFQYSSMFKACKLNKKSTV